jgi:hypothetical protein
MEHKEQTIAYLNELKTATEDINLSAKNRALAAGILAHALQQIEAAKSRTFTADEYPIPLDCQTVLIGFNAHMAWGDILAKSKFGAA